MAQGEVDYYSPHHALTRLDFGAKKAPDLARAWLVLRPWSLSLYKSPAHLKHRPLASLKVR